MWEIYFLGVTFCDSEILLLLLISDITQTTYYIQIDIILWWYPVMTLAEYPKL